jgi:hypothetical protein
VDRGVVRLGDLVGWDEQAGYYIKGDEETVERLRGAGIHVNADNHTVELRDRQRDGYVLVIFADYLLMVYIVPPEKEDYVDGFISHPFHVGSRGHVRRVLNSPVVAYDRETQKYRIRWDMIDDIAPPERVVVVK